MSVIRQNEAIIARRLRFLQMKSLSKIVLALYLLTLLWLVLFKFSFDIATVLTKYQIRSLNLIPFAGSSIGSLRQHLMEMISNIIVFVPFGLLLGVNLKQTTFWRKLTLIFIFSLSVEILQSVLAIGRTDITDIITNTLGGIVGLKLYNFSNKHIDNQKMDRLVIITGIILLILFILIRLLFLHIKCQPSH
jgi:glycopeptide antibiotics resistance protein